MTRWLLLLSYEECVVTDTESAELCVDVLDKAGLTGEACLETVDRVVWKVHVSSSAILNGVRCFVTVGGASSRPMSLKSRWIISVVPDEVDLEDAACDRAFSLSSTNCETKGEECPSSQRISSLLLSYELTLTGVACLFAAVCVFSGDVFEGDVAILDGVRFIGDGIFDPKALAFEGGRGESGESMVITRTLRCIDSGTGLLCYTGARFKVVTS